MSSGNQNLSFVDFPSLGIQSSFFLEMVFRFGGKKYHKANGKDAYRVTCPACGCDGAVMGLGKQGTTYMLLCPNKGNCCLPGYTKAGQGGLNLHQIINHYGGDKLLREWLKAGRTKNYYEDWLPIKSRRQRISS